MTDRQEEEDALNRKQRLAEGGGAEAEDAPSGDRSADTPPSDAQEDPPADDAPPAADAESKEAPPADDPPPADDAGAQEAPPADDPPPTSDAGAPAGSTVFIPRITAGAFVEDEGVRQALDRAAEDRRMQRASLEVTAGDMRTATETFRDEPPPELLIVESRLAGAELFDALEGLAEQCPPGTRVLVVGHENDVRLYRQLLRFGVGDYLVAPVEPLQLIEAIGQLFQEGAAERLGKVVAFIGARGGAGSSTVALNVAAALGHHCHASALMIDLDVNFGTAALELNLEPAQGVREALEEGDRVDATLLDRLTTPYDDRLGVLAAPCKLGDGPQPDPAAVAQLIETARTTTPHLLLDLPCAWTPVVRKALLAADEIVLTATPDLAALRNARNMMAALKSARRNDVPPRLVLNGFGVPKRKELSVEDFQRVLELEPAVQVPHDPATFSAASAKGEPVALASTAAAQPFNTLARILTGQKEARARGGVGGWARRLLTGRS